MKRRGLFASLLFGFALLAGLLVACSHKSTYTLSFETNGADPIASITATAGERITPPENPSRIGYIFEGWYLSKDFEGAAQTLPTVMPSENRTYYAKWKEATYTLTLDPSGGSLSVTSYTVGHGTNLLAFLQGKTPTREGNLRFGGWFLGERAVSASDVVTGPLTLTAGWEAPYTAVVYLQQLNAEKTAASDTYILSEAHAASGWALLGKAFTPSIAVEHYVLNLDHADGNASIVIAESGNAFTLYYDLETLTIHYDANSESSYTGSMPDDEFPYGAIAQIKDCSFNRAGYHFATWSLSRGALETPPTTAFFIQQSYTVYALWDRGYVNAADSADVIYVSLYQTGSGQVYRYDGGVRKNGFLEANEFIPWVFEFEFIYDTGSLIGRIDATTGTFRYRGEEEGIYLYYDYVGDVYETELLYLDGYGESVWGVMDTFGGINFGDTFGRYAYDATYDDFRFTYIDVVTHEETGDYFYFRLSEKLPEDEHESLLKGAFLVQGYESGTYLLFDVASSEILYEYVLELDGYGNAREKYVHANPNTQVEEIETLSVGTYRATALYEDHMGEWEYVPAKTTDEEASFRFILNAINGGDTSISVYLMYDESLAGILTSSTGSDACLELYGYNAAAYYPNGLSGQVIYGAFLIADDVLTFTPYEEGEATGFMIFVIEWATEPEHGDPLGTFTLNEDGFIVVGGTLTGYVGSAPVLEIPSRVTAIADDALSYMKISSVLRSVTIPASVTSIGARAFENNYTLSRAIFLATQPIDIDWDNTVNPFRWPKGDFVIVVPEGCGDTYRAAWTDCPYTIATQAELNNRPEFEVVGGVLVAYNCKVSNPQDLDLTIPEGVTEIAPRVFFALDYIKSVNLNNVITVGESAFAQCASLASVTAPNVQTVGNAAFALCESLQTISLPSVRTLGEEAFSACYLLTRVTLGANVAQIGSYAFAYCASEAEDLTVFVEFEGNTVPAVGGNAFYGCVARRISVDTVSTALKYFAASDWQSYVLSLWVRASAASALVGEWVDLASLQPVTFNGRAELFLVEVWLYHMSGSAVTFYIADSSARGGYTTVLGSYESGMVSFTYNGTPYLLARTDAPVTYTSDTDTLSLDLSNANYDSYPFTVPATLNDRPVTLNVSFSAVTAVGYMIDGRKNALTFKLNINRTFTYTAKIDDMIGPFTADDGAEVTFRYTGALITAAGTFYIDEFTITGTTYGWVAREENATTYTISIPWRSTTYLVTVELTGESTFTYSYVVGNSRKVIYSSNNAGAVVAVYDKTNTLTLLQLMLPSTVGGTNEMVESTYAEQSDGSYLFTVDFTVELFDEASGTVYYEPSPLNGTYYVSIDFAHETCTIIKQS